MLDSAGLPRKNPGAESPLRSRQSEASITLEIQFDGMTEPCATPFEAVCLDWLNAHLDCFAIDWNAGSTEIYRRLKPYAELGLLAYIEPTVPDRGMRKRVTRWLTDHAPAPEALREVARQFPQAFPWTGMILQHRAALGIATPELRKVVGDLSRQQFVRHFERPVGHEIAVHNILRHLGCEPDSCLADLYSRTMLAQKTWDDPTDTAIYFLCHDVFFLTDWGKQELPACVQDQSTWLRKFSDWHQDRTASGNIDLAAELWLAMSFWRGRAPALNKVPSSAVATAKAVMPPIPEGQGTGFIRQGDSERQIAFFQNYHTVLVCLLGLRRGWTADR